MASISDVAHLAGVSTASVSRVLSGQTVRPAVREKVLGAVKTLNYRPNRVARSLRSSKSTTIGLIVADIQNPYFTNVSRAVEDMASQNGYAVFLCNSDEDPAKESTYLRLLGDENVAGVIVAPTAETLGSLSPDDTNATPVVVIDRSPGRLQIDSVVVDNALAASDLTTHLLEHGRRRIAGLFGAHSATGRERYRGFAAAHQARQVVPVESLVRFVAPREQSGYDAVHELLAGKEKPDAILTSNGLLATGAFRALNEHGGCPEAIAFASFDDTTWMSLVRPPITVIEQPTYEIGRTALELLLARIADPRRPARNTILPHRLVIRQSCGCPPR